MTSLPQPTPRLPELLTFANGGRVGSAADWRRRRRECLDKILATEYGGLPPPPRRIDCALLCRRSPGSTDAQPKSIETFRVTARADGVYSLTFQLIAPPADRPCAVIVNGDGCWRQPSEAVIDQVLSRGYALALFNRTELVADRPPSADRSDLHDLYADGSYGALSAWAWGYHRCVDALTKIESVDASKIIVTGHSRGGKAALLAGATDERIALTVPNNSGCGGAGCFHFAGPKAETLAPILRAFDYWFGPEIRQYVGRDAELPFDQHFLKAAIAPRALLSTEALGDLWANPQGTWLTHQAAREVYRFLGCEDRIGIHFRQGQHRQTPEDWATLVDYADWIFHGQTPPERFDVNPFA